jgi:hypothetical protein
MKFNQYDEVAKQYGVGGGGDWFNLKEGENKIRLLTEFETYGEHYNPSAKKYTVCIGKEKGCLGCKNGIPITVRSLGWVIDRTDGKVKLFKMPYTVFKAIGLLQTDDDYKFDLLPEYDLKINRTGTGKETEYSVLPTPKITALTGDELEEMDETIKPVKDIIQKMKDKVGGSEIKQEDYAQTEVPVEAYESTEG